MRRECRERFPRYLELAIPACITCTCVTHVPWCMPGSLTSSFLRSRWRGKRSRHSRRMRNPHFCVSGKRPISMTMTSHERRHVSNHKLLVQELVHTNNNRTVKVPYYCFVASRFNWWPVYFPHSRAVMRNCFHVMISSWYMGGNLIFFLEIS